MASSARDPARYLLDESESRTIFDQAIAGTVYARLTSASEPTIQFVTVLPTPLRALAESGAFRAISLYDANSIELLNSDSPRADADRLLAVLESQRDPAIVDREELRALLDETRTTLAAADRPAAIAELDELRAEIAR